MAFHDFRERLEFSEGIALTDEMLRTVYQSIPAAKSMEKASTDDDRNGTDYWIHRHHGLPSISIDLKNREFCPIERFNSDDACIETTSVYRGPNRRPWLDCHRYKPGWTIDQKKRTDLVVYTWPHSADLLNDVGMRYWILYFPHLCEAANRNWREWSARFCERPAVNSGYLTLSVYVPRVVIAKAIKEITTNIILPTTAA